MPNCITQILPAFLFQEAYGKFGPPHWQFCGQTVRISAPCCLDLNSAIKRDIFQKCLKSKFLLHKTSGWACIIPKISALLSWIKETLLWMVSKLKQCQHAKCRWSWFCSGSFSSAFHSHLCFCFSLYFLFSFLSFSLLSIFLCFSLFPIPLSSFHFIFVESILSAI